MGNYIVIADIDNWPATYTDAQKNAVIARIELQLEKITQTHFYSKALSFEMNGNGKNRIFPPIEAEIITITDVSICNTSLPSDWYDWDEHSVFLDLCGSGAGSSYGVSPWVELTYMLTDVEETGIFPRGFNNIRISGTYGNVALLLLAKQACLIMIRYENDPTAYKKYFKSERIGDYNYSYPEIGKWGNIYTGIREADELIDLLIQDSPIISTP